jgi:arylsulfatase A-like enzyme
MWDPHTPYRSPKEFGEPFKDDPLPAWLTEEVRQKHWNACGPHSAQEVTGFGPGPYDEEVNLEFPRQPIVIDSMQQVRRMFDGYDTGVVYADKYIGEILNALADQNVLDDTAVIVSADHGENLGELNIYGDHQTADHITSRVPLVVSWPGVTTSPRVDTALHYHFDFAATTIELLGGKVPAIWDGVSFAGAMKQNRQEGRDYLVLSQGAWSCQRAVRFEDFVCIRSYHDGYHGFPEVMLFDVRNDPHEQHDASSAKPQAAAQAMAMLDEWQASMMRSSTIGFDPMWTVVREGGALHTRDQLPAYLKRLRQTGRAQWADGLARRYPREAGI